MGDVGKVLALLSEMAVSGDPDVVSALLSHRVLHFSGHEPYSKYQLGLASLPVLSAHLESSGCGPSPIPESFVSPSHDPPPGAPRPQNSQLGTDALVSLLNVSSIS